MSDIKIKTEPIDDGYNDTLNIQIKEEIKEEVVENNISEDIFDDLFNPTFIDSIISDPNTKSNIDGVSQNEISNINNDNQKKNLADVNNKPNTSLSQEVILEIPLNFKIKTEPRSPKSSDTNFMEIDQQSEDQCNLDTTEVEISNSSKKVIEESITEENSNILNYNKEKHSENSSVDPGINVSSIDQTSETRKHDGKFQQNKSQHKPGETSNTIILKTEKERNNQKPKSIEAIDEENDSIIDKVTKVLETIKKSKKSHIYRGFLYTPTTIYTKPQETSSKYKSPLAAPNRVDFKFSSFKKDNLDLYNIRKFSQLTTNIVGTIGYDINLLNEKLKLNRVPEKCIQNTNNKSNKINDLNLATYTSSATQTQAYRCLECIKRKSQKFINKEIQCTLLNNNFDINGFNKYQQKAIKSFCNLMTSIPPGDNNGMSILREKLFEIYNLSQYGNNASSRLNFEPNRNITFSSSNPYYNNKNYIQPTIQPNTMMSIEQPNYNYVYPGQIQATNHYGNVIPQFNPNTQVIMQPDINSHAINGNNINNSGLNKYASNKNMRDPRKRSLNNDLHEDGPPKKYSNN